MDDAARIPFRMVLLRHVGSPEGDHCDWFVQRPENPQGLLLSFRLQERCDTPGPTQFLAQQLTDHRAIYLIYEGELSRNRGVVRRVAEGVVLALHESQAEIDLHAQWHGHSQSTRWTFRRSSCLKRDLWQVQATFDPAR